MPSQVGYSSHDYGNELLCCHWRVVFSAFSISDLSHLIKNVNPWADTASPARIFEVPCDSRLIIFAKVR
jgi:hypothetical protein